MYICTLELDIKYLLTYQYRLFTDKNGKYTQIYEKTKTLINFCNV